MSKLKVLGMQQEVVMVEKPKETKQETSTKSEPQSIDTLPGVGAATAEKLREAGFDTLMSLAVASPAELVEVCAIGESVAKRIINVARSKLDMGFETGIDLLKRRQEVIRLSTGSKAFDAMIAGGFETGAISEAYGEFASSKSQIAHVLAVRTQLPVERGGANGSVIFIDGESTFRPERIKQMAEALKLDPLETLKNISVARAFNSDHQMLIAEKAEDLIKQKMTSDRPVRLIVVDSLTSHFRADFVGRGQLADRQQKLNKHMHTLMKLASQYNVCVYVTNQVMAKPDTFFGDPTAAIGGNIVGHNCLAAGTLVQLPDGRIRKIEEMFDEGQVSSIDLEKTLHSQQTTVGTVVVKKKDKAYNIQTNHRIRSSGEHRFFTVENFAIKEIRAKNLNKGQFIAHGFNLALEGQVQKLPSIAQEQLISVTPQGAQLILKTLSANNITQNDLCENLAITPRQLRRVLHQHYPTNKKNVDLLIKQGVPAELSANTRNVFTHKHKDLVIPEYLTIELAQLLGYFLGDGCLEERSLRFKDERLEVLESYRRLAYQLFHVGGKMRKIKDKNCYELSLNSVAIRELFSQLSEQLFDYIGKSPKTHIASFVRGFFDADGSIDEATGMISASQRDDETAITVQLFLDRLGIRSKIRKYLHNGNPINQLGIKDNRAIWKFNELVGFTAEDKQRKLQQKLDSMVSAMVLTPVRRTEVNDLLRSLDVYPSKVLRPKSYEYVGERELRKVIDFLMQFDEHTTESREKLNFLIQLLNSELAWEKVSKITVEATDEWFYDFSADKLHNYIANGFCLHNSQTRIYLRKGKKGTRVGKLVDSPYLADAECIFRITDAGLEDVEE